jgi:hypothetical protein
VRFVPKSNPSKILIGEPVDPKLDVGLALYQGQEVSVRPFSGSSVLSPGKVTEATETIDRILSPLAQAEVGTIRCIGLNVSRTAHPMAEAKIITYALVCLPRQGDVPPNPGGADIVHEALQLSG